MRAALALALCLGAGAAAAHDGHRHPEPAPPPPQAMAPLPFADRVGGPFALIDQNGNARTEADPDGRAQLLFFGYANCPGICSSVLPALAELTDRLAEAGHLVTPVLITVDPAFDTQAALAVAAPRIHPRLAALTGSDAALAAARASFQVEAGLMFVDPEHGPIYAHGSFVYLLDPVGAVLTLLPPILSPERMTEIVKGYLEPQT